VKENCDGSLPVILDDIFFKTLDMKKSLLLRILLTSFAITFLTQINAQPAGYGFGKQLLINSSQVSGSTDLSDFVMLVNFTDNDLRTTANGGNVENASGFDIMFTLADCTTPLDHQIEEYNPTTGELIAWVKVPTVFATSNTNIHMYYGNSSVSADPSTSSVWGAEYAGVWHMNQSPAGTAPQITDYTSNTNNGTANGSMTAADLVSAQIGNGIDFDGSNDFIDCGADASTDIGGDLTVSAWMNSTTASGHIINRGGGWDDPGYSLFLLNNGIRIELQRAGEKDIVDNGIGINAWRYVALTYNGTSNTIRCYIDGIQQTNTGNHTGPIGSPVENLNIGRKEQNGFYFNGIIDEGRVISAERSADWILTEYNNQNSPSTFYTKSAEFTASNLCSTLPVELLEFSVQPINKIDALLDWTTASELNNDFFVVQKSINGYEWTDIAKIKGAGNSAQKRNYKYVDNNVTTLVTYYRVKQVDFDGSIHFFDTKSFRRDNGEIAASIYPNPTTNFFVVKPVVNETVRVYDITGKLMIEAVALANKELTVNITRLSAGTYFVKRNSEIEKLIKY